MNRLLEVYSRGLYDSLNKENMADVVEYFQKYIELKEKKISLTMMTSSSLQ